MLLLLDVAAGGEVVGGVGGGDYGMVEFGRLPRGIVWAGVSKRIAGRKRTRERGREIMAGDIDNFSWREVVPAYTWHSFGGKVNYYYGHRFGGRHECHKCKHAIPHFVACHNIIGRGKNNEHCRCCRQ